MVDSAAFFVHLWQPNKNSECRIVICIHDDDAPRSATTRIIINRSFLRRIWPYSLCYFVRLLYLAGKQNRWVDTPRDTPKQTRAHNRISQMVSRVLDITLGQYIRLPAMPSVYANWRCRSIQPHLLSSADNESDLCVFYAYLWPGCSFAYTCETAQPPHYCLRVIGAVSALLLVLVNYHMTIQIEATIWSGMLPSNYRAKIIIFH